jgi:hypothetical protein
VQCFTLAEYMLELTARDYGLRPAPGHGPPVLRVAACSGHYDCDCPRCTAARAELVRRGARGSGGRQPWDPIPAKAKAA